MAKASIASETWRCQLRQGSKHCLGRLVVVKAECERSPRPESLAAGQWKPDADPVGKGRLPQARVA